MSRDAVGRTISKFATYYAFTAAISVTILILLMEIRIDVYISILILEYYIFRALITHGLAGEGIKLLKILDYTYFIIFMIIVGIRVLEILYPEMIWWLM